MSDIHAEVLHQHRMAVDINNRTLKGEMQWRACKIPGDKPCVGCEHIRQADLPDMEGRAREKSKSVRYNGPLMIIGFGCSKQHMKKYARVFTPIGSIPDEPPDWCRLNVDED